MKPENTPPSEHPFSCLCPPEALEGTFPLTNLALLCTEESPFSCGSQGRLCQQLQGGEPTAKPSPLPRVELQQRLVLSSRRVPHKKDTALVRCYYFNFLPAAKY